jgi:uncharacterized protein
MISVLLTAAVLAQATPEWGERHWGTAFESLRDGEDWSHHYVAKKATCPNCSAEFAAASVGTHTTSGKELDFKIRKYVSANPYLFWLWMCPDCDYCGYAGTFDEPLDEEARTKVRKALGPSEHFSSYFDVPFSVLLRRAEQCLVARGATEQELAWLLLYGAWMARDSKEPEHEKEFHRRARELFEVVAEQETGEVEGNDRAAAAYLVGEIHRRYGELDRAEVWLAKAEKIATEVASDNIPAWITACRTEIAKAPQGGKREEK